MQKFVVLVVFLGLLSLPLMAADKVEVFGGYQYLHLGNVGGSGQDVNLNGWDTSLTAKFNKYLGVTADFGGAYKTENILIDVGHGLGVANVNAKAHVYTYTFGPVVSFPAGPIKPFAHVLLGGAHASLSGCVVGEPSECGSEPSQNGFAMLFGGGVDAKVNKVLAVRLVDVDWVYYRFSGVGESNNVRITTGVVFRF